MKKQTEKDKLTALYERLSHEWEECEVRRRIAILLEPLAEDKDCYLQFMDRYLKAYQKNNGYIGEPEEL